jgi:hypothetical protein
MSDNTQQNNNDTETQTIFETLFQLKTLDCAQQITNPSASSDLRDIQLLNDACKDLKLPKEVKQQRELEVDLIFNACGYYSKLMLFHLRSKVYNVFCMRQNERHYLLLQWLLIWMQRDHFKSIFDYVMMKFFNDSNAECVPLIKLLVEHGLDFSILYPFHLEATDTIQYLQTQAAILQRKLEDSLSTSLIPDIRRDIGAFVIFVEKGIPTCSPVSFPLS